MKPLRIAAVTALALFFVVVGCVRTSASAQREYRIHYHYSRLVARPLLTRVHRARTALPSFNVTFHGGPIQPATASYTIFWQPPGTYMSPRYKELINRFLSDVGGSPIYGAATAYFGSNGRVRNESHLKSTWTDRTPYPASLRTGDPDATLQKEIAKVMKRNRWQGGVYSQFFIFTAKDAIPLQHIGYCAYHSAFNEAGLRPVPYAFTPYVGSLNGCNPPYGISPNSDVDADGTILSVSHEQMEMITDPLLNAWYDDQNGVEIGDICVLSFGVSYLPDGGNLDLNGHDYFLQEEYSQSEGACLPNL